MAVDLIQQIEQCLQHLHVDMWGERDAPIVRLTKGAHLSKETEALVGNIEISIPTRSGEVVPYFTQSLNGVKDLEGAKDKLAAALSEVLMTHTEWPR